MCPQQPGVPNSSGRTKSEATKSLMDRDQMTFEQRDSRGQNWTLLAVGHYLPLWLTAQVGTKGKATLEFSGDTQRARPGARAAGSAISQLGGGQVAASSLRETHLQKPFKSNKTLHSHGRAFCSPPGMSGHQQTLASSFTRHIAPPPQQKV